VQTGRDALDAVNGMRKQAAHIRITASGNDIVAAASSKFRNSLAAYQVHWQWVRAHTGLDPGNDWVDKRAKSASQGYSSASLPAPESDNPTTSIGSSSSSSSSSSNSGSATSHHHDDQSTFTDSELLPVLDNSGGLQHHEEDQLQEQIECQESGLNSTE
jgi:hypothetical protein